MKKSLVTLAALAVIGSASAQSSVTIFGVVDATAMVGNGDISNKTQLGNSGYSSTRLGFKGDRELGGGLKAAFWLEAGVNNDNGNGTATNINNQPSGGAAVPAINGSQGLTFNRLSTVSLLGGFGELRLGRDYTPVFANEAGYDPFTINGVGTSRAFVGGSAVAGNVTAVRASNSFGYLSPSMGGFAVNVQTYLGENASTAGNIGDGSSFKLGYNKGPISLGLAYAKTKVNATDSLQISNLGGSYDFGIATLKAYVQRHQLDGAHDVNGYLIGGLAPVGPGKVRLSYSTTDNGAGKTNQLALGYVYDLDQNTSIYGTFVTVNNSNGAAAALNGAVTSVNGSSNGLDLGIKYAF